MKIHKGIAIAIAWPETFCKQPGAWYDGITFRLGINKNHYYKVGHAALVLIDSEKMTCHYFDFGRYHTPFQTGRVRGSNTDFDLKMSTKPKVSSNGNKLENFKEILEELQKNHACHGEGAIHASYCSVNFQKSFSKVMEMQKASPIAYGPFTFGGSNCSRFVNTAILSGEPKKYLKFKLKYFQPLSPTPIGNVNALPNKIVLPKVLKKKPFYPFKPLEFDRIKTPLPSPEKAATIPVNAQWLSGEGAGSWFACSTNGENILVTRYSPEGEVECEGTYDNHLHLKNIHKNQITYPSNCAEVSFLINDKKYTLDRI